MDGGSQDTRMDDVRGQELGRSFMVSAFRAFHGKVVSLRERAARNDPDLVAGASKGDGKADGPEAKAQAVSAQLIQYLDDAARQAESAGGAFAAHQFSDAQYVMAAVADEIFLHFVNWDGKRFWKDNLLESRLFGTFVAGERLFRKIEALLKRRDPADWELGAVYLMALALGFRGRYRGVDDKGTVARLQSELYTFVFGHRPETIDHTTPLFDAAYAPPLSQPADRRLPYLRKWIIAITAIVVLFLIVQHALWFSATTGLVDIIDQVGASRPGAVHMAPPAGDGG